MSLFDLTVRATPSPGAFLPRLALLLSASGDAADPVPGGADARAAADAADVRLCRQGDHDAFERIVRRYQQEIARRLQRFSRDANVIEELTQETFVQAYTSLGSFRGESPLVHWLHRIAVRAGYRYWKQLRKGRVRIVDEAVAAAPAQADTETLWNVLNQLSPRDRLVVSLLYLEGYSCAHTAMLTGWSQTMVKVQAFRARARLRKLMLEHDNQGERP